MFPGMLLHRSTVIICAHHVTHVGPITIVYFGKRKGKRGFL